ncbi:hypothetical protein LI113_20425, partial [Phocaeicola vulgatus]|nr:hypothetical protein [Phocaeicola vulgatus]MCG4690597.1 hypothetical protein [Phocaeicola vulgatus]MCG4731239.1 hypothetical protein [Phocaeicola vulgatus]
MFLIISEIYLFLFRTHVILQCAEVGADVVTCSLSAIKGLLNHPLTDIGLEKFLADYKKVNG